MVSVCSIRVIRENPVVAMEWAQSIDAVELRHDTVVRGLQAWMRYDRDAADAWIESSGLPSAVVERIVPPPSDR